LIPAAAKTASFVALVTVVTASCKGRLQQNGVTRGRCYDHNFLRVFPIFRKKMAFFLNTNVMIIFFKI
jgi:hypothetical protein